MSKTATVLIIGAAGQLGRVVNQAIRKRYSILEHDLKKRSTKHGGLIDIRVDPESAQKLVMHVVVPYTDDFIKIIKEYNRTYNPVLIIIHSTLAPGTTASLVKSGIPAVHSPCIYDDNRFDTMPVFRKMIGYDNPDLGLKAEEHLRPCFNTALISGSFATEMSDICLGLYTMTCRAMTFEISRMFQIAGLNYQTMRELIHYNNMGFATAGNTSNLLFNMPPVLNKNDYRRSLMDLLPKELISAFFLLAEKSYQIENAEKKGAKDAGKSKAVAV